MDLLITEKDDNPIIKITIEKEKELFILEGVEAKKWLVNNRMLATIADLSDSNPFDENPVKWQIKKKVVS